jgi:hypothetical protein
MDVFSTEQGIRISFDKTSAFRGVVPPNPPIGTPLSDTHLSCTIPLCLHWVHVENVINRYSRTPVIRITTRICCDSGQLDFSLKTGYSGGLKWEWGWGILQTAVVGYIRTKERKCQSIATIMINFIWLHVSTRNESSSAHLNLLLWPNSDYK